MDKKFKKGQSILEYTLLLGAIIAVLVAVLLGPSGIKDKVKATYEKFGTAVDTTTTKLDKGIFSQ